MRILPAIVLGAVLTLASGPGVSGGGDLTATVTAVSDGDTFTVQWIGSSQQTNKVRLYSVDAPEKTQRDGPQAKQFAADLLLNQQVKIKNRGISYDRIVGIVSVGDRDVALELAKGGWAWWYSAYSPESHHIGAAEAEARAQKRGIWTDKRVTPPWVFRDLKKAGQLLPQMKAQP